MYACAWIFVSAPTVVSFSTSAPRPTTTSSPIVTRSRTHDWSPRMTRAPILVPAKTTAPVETMVPGPISSGASGSRLAVERVAVVDVAPRDERQEVLALELQRLVARDARADDVARPREPLAVVLRG